MLLDRGVRGGAVFSNAVWELVTIWRGRAVGMVNVKAVWFIHLPSRLAPERASCATRHVSVACGGEALLRTVARRVLVPLSSPRLSPSAISRFDRSVSVVVVVIDVIPDRIVLLRCVIIRGMELETHRLQSREKKGLSRSLG